MKKLFIPLFLILILVVLGNPIFASGTKEASKESVEFMTGTSIDSALYKSYEKMVAAFAAEYPEAATVELIPSSTDHEGEIKVRLGGGNIPDMWMTHGWSLGRYSEYLMDLQDQSWVKDINPLLNGVMVGSNNEIYALPLNVDVAGILYNRDVLASVGYTPEDIKTWDDFIACSDAIKKSGKTPIYNAGKDRWPTGLYVDWIAPSFFTDNDTKSMTEGTFVSEKYRKVLSLIDEFAKRDFFNPDYASATSDDVARALAQGQVGFSFLMNFVLVTAYEYAPNANMGFMQIPNVPGKSPYYVTGEKDAIGIAKDGKNVESCLQFVNFLARPDNISELATATGQMTGLVTSSSDLGPLADSFAASTSYEGVPYFDRVYMPSGSWDAIVATSEMVVLGSKSVDEALAQIEKEYNSLTNK